MLFKKINKSNNKGATALNYAIAMICTLILIAILWDFIGLARAKIILSRFGEQVSICCINQSGFDIVAPDDWVSCYDKKGKDKYMTVSNISKLFETTSASSQLVSNSLVVSYKGDKKYTNILGQNKKALIDWQEQGTLTFKADYKPVFSPFFGLTDEYINISCSYPVCGLWIHKTDKF